MADELRGLNISEHQVRSEADNMIDQIHQHATNAKDAVSLIDIEPMSDLAEIADAYNKVVRRFRAEKEHAIEYAQEIVVSMATLEKTQEKLFER